MKTHRSEPLNIGVAIRVFTLSGYSLFFVAIILTGDVYLYVHPRIIPFLILAALVMAGMAWFQAGRLFQPGQKQTDSFSLLIFVIPLLMAMAFPAQTFDSSTRTVGDVSLTGDGLESIEGDNASDSDGQLMEAQDNTIPEDEGLILTDGVFVMNGDNFYKCLCAIYEDPSRYVGMAIEVVGFVFKDNETFGDNLFVPARLMMVCCAADMVPMGFLCRFEGVPDLEADSWVRVTGVIAMTDYEGNSIPCIEAQSVELADKPDQEYVYPYS